MLEDSFIPLTLARILRPWGRRGEVAAEILTDFPERLTERREAWLAAEGKARRPAKILSCRLHLGQAIFHFEGVESISDAETLRGLEVQVPLSERAPAGEGRHYIADLIGCAIWEAGAADSAGNRSRRAARRRAAARRGGGFLGSRRHHPARRTPHPISSGNLHTY